VVNGRMEQLLSQSYRGDHRPPVAHEHGSQC
jgi:hypothetical protein